MCIAQIHIYVYVFEVQIFTKLDIKIKKKRFGKNDNHSPPPSHNIILPIIFITQCNFKNI